MNHDPDDKIALLAERDALKAKLDASVPVEDVRPLLEIAALAVRGSSINQNEVAKLLIELRAKYPNLFPK